MFQHAKQTRDKKGNWKKRRIVWVFWQDGDVSELCEKWICCYNKYAYTTFEEHRTHSGEVLFTRELKATISKDKSDTYIDIDELQMFKDFSTKDKVTTKNKTKTEDKDKTTLKTNTKTKTKTKTEDKNKTTLKTKTKTETEDKNRTTLKTKTKTEVKDKTKTKTKDKDPLDKINNKISAINKLNKGLAKVKADVTKKVELIYQAMCQLQDEIYSDDSWLRLVELNKADAITDDVLNVVWNTICVKNRISTEKIKIDKHKDIDGYVSKLTEAINNKIELVNRMCQSIDHVMSEIKNETNMIDERIHKVSEMDNDTLHLINDKLKEIINQSRKNLRKIVV